jgi:hypothetical protein
MLMLWSVSLLCLLRTLQVLLVLMLCVIAHRKHCLLDAALLCLTLDLYYALSLCCALIDSQQANTRMVARPCLNLGASLVASYTTIYMLLYCSVLCCSVALCYG